MSDPEPRRRTLLDGRHRWGTVTRQAGRYGAESIHVRIYPPDSSVLLRRLARGTRLWPLAGAGLTVLIGLSVPALVDVPTAAAFITTLIFVLVVWAVLAWISRPVRSWTISFLATSSTLFPQHSGKQRYEHAVAVSLRLEQNEKLYDHGTIGWDEYRAEWARAYETLRTY